MEQAYLATAQKQESHRESFEEDLLPPSGGPDGGGQQSCRGQNCVIQSLRALFAPGQPQQGGRDGGEEGRGPLAGSLDIHFQSPQPRKLGAEAYTYGRDIYIAPGQERYLEHELGHALQQSLGLVTPNKEINGLPLNDDEGLERQADDLARSPALLRPDVPPARHPPVIQRMCHEIDEAPKENKPNPPAATPPPATALPPAYAQRDPTPESSSTQSDTPGTSAPHNGIGQGETLYDLAQHAIEITRKPADGEEKIPACLKPQIYPVNRYKINWSKDIDSIRIYSSTLNRMRETLKNFIIEENLKLPGQMIQAFSIAASIFRVGNCGELAAMSYEFMRASGQPVTTLYCSLVDYVQESDASSDDRETTSLPIANYCNYDHSFVIIAPGPPDPFVQTKQVRDTSLIKKETGREAKEAALRATSIQVLNQSILQEKNAYIVDPWLQEKPMSIQDGLETYGDLFGDSDSSSQESQDLLTTENIEVTSLIPQGEPQPNVHLNEEQRQKLEQRCREEARQFWTEEKAI